MLERISTSIYNTEPTENFLAAFDQNDMNRVPEICNGLSEGVAILTANLEIVDVNYTMKKWYSDRKAIIGKKCYAVFHNRNLPCENCPAIRSVERRAHERAVVVHETVNSERVGVQDLQTFPVLDNEGEIALIIEYISDVTVLRDRNHELVQAHREVSRLRMHNHLLSEKVDKAENRYRILLEEIQHQLDSIAVPLLEDLRFRVSNLDKELIDEVIRTISDPINNTDYEKDVDTGDGTHPDLTMREVEVLRFTQNGMSSKDIARELSVSPRTVDYHRQQLRKKLNLCGDSRRLSTRLAPNDVSSKTNA